MVPYILIITDFGNVLKYKDSTQKQSQFWPIINEISIDMYKIFVMNIVENTEKNILPLVT